MIKQIVRASFVILFAPFLTTALYAQNSTLRGQVVDELNAVIPNAEITLIGKDGKERKTKSSFTGEFSIPNVPPGTYTLTTAYPGFQTAVVNDLKIPQGSSPLTVQMAIAAVEVITDVSANNTAVSTEPDQNMNATVLGEDFIKTLPDDEDELRDYLNALAGGGANGQGAQIMIDGFSGGRLPPKEAIMQININMNPFSAEFSNAGFNRIEIITRPGNGSWRGGGSFSMRNSALDARNAFALTKPDLAQQRYSFNFGGPIIRKKWDFFSNLERRNLDGSGTVFAQTLDGPFVANVLAPNDNTSLFIRSGYLLNNNNTITGTYSFSRSESLNREFSSGGFGGGFGFFGGGGGGGGFGGGGGGFGGGGGGQSGNFTLPERGSNSENLSHSLRLSATSIINSRLINEARFRWEREHRTLRANTQGVAINVLDAFNGGGATCCPNESRQNNFELQNYLTYTQKKHTIKGGIQVEDEFNNDLSGSNFNGTYTFSSLEQYRRALAGEPGVTATQFTLNRGNPQIKYSQYQASWFIQDDWRTRQNLTISFGLRHEFQQHLQDRINFAPRFGVAWSPFKDRKTTFRFGGGVFYNRLGAGTYENVLRYDGVTQQSLTIRNAAFKCVDQNAPRTVESCDPFAGNPNINISNTIVRVLDPNLTTPYSISISSSVERQLPKNLVATFTYVHTRGLHQFRSRNINAPRLVNGVIERPHPTKGNIFQIESSAKSESTRYEFGLGRRFGRLTIFGNYRLTFNKSNADGIFSTPADNYNLANEWGRASFDGRHTFFMGGSISLPYGFRVAPMINAGTGSPFNITTGLDNNNDTSFTDRPAGISRNSDLPASLYSQVLAAYDRDPISRQRVAATLALYPNGVIAQGPGRFQVNGNISRTFGFGGSRDNQSAQAQGGPGGQGDGGGRGGRGGGFGGGGRGGGGGGGGRGIGGPGGGPGIIGGPGGGPGFGGGESSRYNLTISAQFTNILNRVNFNQYSGVLTSPFFNLPSSAAPARQIELQVRFNF